MSNGPISPSPRLRPIPEIDPHRHVEVAPPGFSHFLGWADLFARNPDAWDYLLKPGDYRAWGTLEIHHAGGHCIRPKTIRYHDPDVPEPTHPVHQSVASRVRIRSFKVSTNTAQNWFLHGLSSDGDRLPNDPGGGLESMVQEGSRNIVVDYCLFERHSRYNLRIREATDVSVQRFVEDGGVRTLQLRMVIAGGCDRVESVLIEKVHARGGVGQPHDHRVLEFHRRTYLSTFCVGAHARDLEARAGERTRRADDGPTAQAVIHSPSALRGICWIIWSRRRILFLVLLYFLHHGLGCLQKLVPDLVQVFANGFGRHLCQVNIGQLATHRA